MDLKSLIQPKPNPKVPDFKPGDTVRVNARVVEGERERIQAFEGVVIRKRRGGINSNFTVRRVSHGVGVERTFMLYSPRLDSVQVVRVGRVRRAKLYYLRQRVGRKARIRAGSRDRFEELTRQLAEGELLPEDMEEEEIQVLEEEAVEGEGEEETVAEAEGDAPSDDSPAEPEAVAEEPVVEPEAATDEPAAEEEPAPEAEPAEEEEKPAE